MGWRPATHRHRLLPYDVQDRPPLGFTTGPNLAPPVHTMTETTSVRWSPPVPPHARTGAGLEWPAAGPACRRTGHSRQPGAPGGPHAPAGLGRVLRRLVDLQPVPPHGRGAAGAGRAAAQLAGDPARPVASHRDVPPARPEPDSLAHAAAHDPGADPGCLHGHPCPGIAGGTGRVVRSRLVARDGGPGRAERARLDSRQPAPVRRWRW